MDSAQWTQEFGVTRSMVEMGGPIASSSPCTVRPSPGAAASMEKKTMKPPKDQTLNCPRCHSTNTKFCYYNNYSLTQPRYFCKSCRRYWTEGGTLRNVPVGGGSRKHTKKSAANSNPNNDHSHPTVVLPLHHHQNPKVHVHDQGQDLNLGYNIGVPRFLEFPKIEGKDVISSSPSSSSTTTATHMSALNFMRSENNINVERGPPYSFMIPNMAPITSSLDHHHHHHHHQTNYALFPSTGFSFQECKPSLASFDGSGYVNSHETEEDVNGTLMFTLGGSKRHSGTGEGGEHDDHEDKGSNENINSNGFWNGMLGGGGSW